MRVFLVLISRFKYVAMFIGMIAAVSHGSWANMNGRYWVVAVLLHVQHQV